ncbi:ATP-binding cassette domain-containing protein [Candidatus Methylopumilus universalis]|uniref:ATP-binding cassette domain-containing protein n=1 Tax=Candidatus Methylopumilus universalis TaxID=2588536 RepID=A0ABX5VUY4_9PROT|nr:ATP-binding cassette domain-containing protein [Candidatus Methylopumilus universalis]QDC51252.1 ATP-binding cassette domain-containing protein [Candidatus Methylopumilus universalis]QDC61390.1 ATP-binding cassette domain-containing protein [Candidatus Methylopumilus universalis]
MIYEASLSRMIQRLWKQISYRRRFQLLILFCLLIFSSFAEVVSIGAVLPFLGMLTSPEAVFAHPWTQFIIQPFGFNTPRQLLLPITLIFAITAFLSALMRFFLLLVQTKLGHAIGADFSLGIYKRTLFQPYAVHVSRNSSEIIAGISTKSKAVVASTILPLMTIVSSSVLLIAILIALFEIQPIISLIAFCGFALIYILLVLVTKRRLLVSSREISEGNTSVIKVIQESLGGIRDVLIDGTQNVHCDAYDKVDAPLRRAVANVQIISISPRYGVEALGMVFIAILAYSMAEKIEGSKAAIPVLGALAMGAQRMLPLLQQIYSSWSSIRGGQNSLNDALDLMDQKLPDHMDDFVEMRFDRCVAFRNVSFKFANDSTEILHDLNIELTKGLRIGIIGNTGSGKSTFLDVFMGLLSPVSGDFLVDDISVNDKNRLGWQRHIAHVPQTIFLSDASIAENIALGVPKENIDHERVRYAAQMAQLTDFINTLDKGYDSLVGERGVKLSGGQRQRIGIARALYKPADVLVLDEATSALDNDTESKVMQAIDAIGGELTIIMVAHRLSTLKKCDQIFELERGRIKRVGTYAEVIERL